MNPMHCIQAEQVAPQAWRNGGGQTRELLAWPDAQNWQLRISRADIAASGPFSAFVGVQRWFAVLSGHGLVLHMPTPDRHTLDDLLLPGHIPVHFDGGLAPGCTLINGPTQDLNLMARGGQACMLAVDTDQPWHSNHTMCGLYTTHSGVWSDGQQTQVLVAHSLLWLMHTPATPMQFRFDDTAPGDTHPPLAFWLGYTPETSPCPRS